MYIYIYTHTHLSAISDVPLVKAIYSIVMSHPRRETRAEAVRDEIAGDCETHIIIIVL